MMAAIFTPPTSTRRFALPYQDRLWSRVPYQRGHTVIFPDPVSGGVTPYPGWQVLRSDVLLAAEAAGAHIYRNAVPTTISVAELVALVDAGYGAHITADPPGAQTELGALAEGGGL